MGEGGIFLFLLYIAFNYIWHCWRDKKNGL